MAEEAVLENTIVEEKVVATPNPFDDTIWKNQPTIAEVKDPTIKEKDEQIKEDKSEVVKPDEPEKIPGASPHPIQDRPDEVKEEVKPTEVKKEDPHALKFANEESEKLFNLLKEGKQEEVYKVLAEQNKLATAEGAEAIKLQLQYQNKDFSSDDINELFNERYEMPEKPVQDLETDEEFAAKIEKYEREVKKVENRISRDAKPAKTELLKLQKEIVLPDIPVSIQSKEPTQEELDAQKEWVEKFSLQVDDGLSKFGGYNTTFKAKVNNEEVELQAAYVPTDKEKETLKPIVALAGTDAGAFMQKLGWVDDKGNINTQKITHDLPMILSREEVLSKILSEGATKMGKEMVKSIKNVDVSGKPSSNGELGETGAKKEEKMVSHFFSQ